MFKSDIIAYRLRHESLVERTGSAWVETPAGAFRAMAFRSLVKTPLQSGTGVTDQEALALIKGDDETLRALSEHGAAPPLVRVHSGDPLTDVFGGILDRGGLMLHAALKKVASEPAGVILYLPREPEPIRFVDALRAVEESRAAGRGLPERDRAPRGASPVVRHYGTGAQILRSLGLTRIRLLTNNAVRLNALRGFGIEVLDSVPLDVG